MESGTCMIINLIDTYEEAEAALQRFKVRINLMPTAAAFFNNNDKNYIIQHVLNKFEYAKSN